MLGQDARMKACHPMVGRPLAALPPWENAASRVSQNHPFAPIEQPQVRMKHRKTFSQIEKGIVTGGNPKTRWPLFFQ